MAQAALVFSLAGKGQLFLPRQGCPGLLRSPRHIPGAQIQGAGSGSLSEKKLGCSLSANLILWGQKSYPQCWWEASPCPPAHGLTGHCPALGCCHRRWRLHLRSAQEGEDAAGSAAAPGLVLRWEHPQGYAWSNNRGACDAQWGAAPLGHPSAAREITLYAITTIYLWYVLIYNIHCVC